MTRGTPYLNKENYNDWRTPAYFYDELNKEFNFDFDPCPLLATVDGLALEWGERNFVNPPYGKLIKTSFVEKAVQESKKGKLCVCLLPVSTSSTLFHDVILPNADEIRFVKGRIKFEGVDKEGNVKKNDSRGAMHDSMIIIFKGTKDDRG